MSLTSMCVPLQSAMSGVGAVSVAVGFGDPEGAAHWLQSTGCPLPYYRSPDRAIYRALGLRR